MKKLILIILIPFYTLSYGQNFVVTPNGLRDEKDIEKTFVVIQADSMTAKQLFDNAMRYIKVSYNNPDYVIKSKIEGDYLKFITRGNSLCVLGREIIDCTYTTVLNFKDGKVKYEIADFEMFTTDRYRSSKLSVHFIKSTWLLGIYNKEGVLKEDLAKRSIENYFNTEMKSVITFLKGKAKLENNW